MEFDAERDVVGGSSVDHHGTVKEVIINKAVSEVHTASESSTASNNDTRTFHQFIDLPLEIRRMIWEDSLPPVVPEVLVYRWKNFYRGDDDDTEDEEELDLRPTVEIDFPVILHACRESRAVALEHVLIRPELTNSVLGRVAEGWWGEGEVSGLEGVGDTCSSSSENDDDSSWGIDRDEEAGFEADDMAGGIRVGDSDTEDAVAGTGHSDGNTATGSPGESGAGPQDAEEVSDESDELEYTTEEDTSDEEVFRSHYYVACRHFRPEFDYIFVGENDLTPFLYIFMGDMPWIPQHLVFSEEAWSLTLCAEYSVVMVILFKDCTHRISIGVLRDGPDPSSCVEQIGQKQRRYRISRHVEIAGAHPLRRVKYQWVEMECILNCSRSG